MPFVYNRVNLGHKFILGEINLFFFFSKQYDYLKNANEKHPAAPFEMC